MQEFEALRDQPWTETFYDPGTADWTQRWTLDGKLATVENSATGMSFDSGPEFGDDAHHAVLWTRPSFEGDLKIEYDYTRTDEQTRAVNILYLHATGSGVEPFDEDITRWAELREVPAMRMYFNHMDLYHISYAAFGNTNDDAGDDYIRARRYLPLAGKGLRGTALEPDVYSRTGLFATGVPHRITVIKRGTMLWMHVRNDEQDYLCRWDVSGFPPIDHGRIGLRQMHARGAIYKDFKVSTLASDE